MACSVHYDVVPLAESIAKVVGIGAVGVVPYYAAKQLLADYRQTMAQLAEKERTEEAARQEARTQYAETIAAARVLSDATFATAERQATREFLLQQVAILAKRIQRLDLPADHAVNERCQAIEAQLAQDAANVSQLTTEYTALSEAVAEICANALPQTPADEQQTVIAAEIASLREMLASSFFAAPNNTAMAEEIHVQLNALAALAAKQPLIALQGLNLLRERIDREIKSYANGIEERAVAQAQLRQTVHETMAKISAVIQNGLPEFVAQAESLLAKLNTTLSGSSDEVYEPLAVLSRDADALFSGCASALRAQANAEVVKARLTDTILSQGMPVMQPIEEEQRKRSSVIAGFRDGLGLEFHFEADGRIRAELVAFSGDVADVFPDTIEEGIALADRIIEALKTRQCTVRERFRHLHKHPEGHRLRIVLVAEQDERAQFQTAVVVPKVMRIDGE